MLIVIYPLPLSCIYITHPCLGTIELVWGRKQKMDPVSCTECGMNRGVGDNVWMFQCSSNTPPTPPSSSLPAITQYSFGTYLTHIPPNSLLQKHQTRPQSRECNRHLHGFLKFLPRISFCPLPFPPPSVDEAGMSPLPGIAN